MALTATVETARRWGPPAASAQDQSSASATRGAVPPCGIGAINAASSVSVLWYGKSSAVLCTAPVTPVDRATASARHSAAIVVPSLVMVSPSIQSTLPPRLVRPSGRGQRRQRTHSSSQSRPHNRTLPHSRDCPANRRPRPGRSWLSLNHVRRVIAYQSLGAGEMLGHTPGANGCRGIGSTRADNGSRTGRSPGTPRPRGGWRLRVT